jgi:hypothetical protein
MLLFAPETASNSQLSATPALLLVSGDPALFIRKLRVFKSVDNQGR